MSNGSTIVLSGLPLQASLPEQPANNGAWPELSGTLSISCASGTSTSNCATTTILSYDNDRQGTVLNYNAGNANGSSGLHLRNITTGSWVGGVYLANSDHIYLDKLACSDANSGNYHGAFSVSQGDPYSTCLALDGTTDDLLATNIGVQNYAYAILDTSASPRSTISYGNLITNIAIASNHSAPYTVVHAGPALILTNLKSSDNTTENNFNVSASWPNTCASPKAVVTPIPTGNQTITCNSSTTTTTVLATGPLIINGGLLTSTGFNVDDGEWANLIISSGTAEQGAPSRGTQIPAPWNDQQGTYGTFAITSGGAVTLTIGIRDAQLTATGSTANGTILLPPNPFLGQKTCVATPVNLTGLTWLDAAGHTTDIVGAPSALGSFSSACFQWDSANWDYQS